MPTRNASAKWEGNLEKGQGQMALGSGAFEGPYSYRSRFKEGTGTNPEELIGAAHAGCFSMALASLLEKGGYNPKRIQTEAKVTLEMVEGAPRITRILLETRGEVPGIKEADFLRIAEDAKRNCPVSKALAGTTIALDAKLTT